MAEQLAVREIASGRRAVVRKKHRRAAVRSDVNRARDQLFAGPALAGNQHGQVVALHPLDLLDDPRHRLAGRDKSWEERLERSIDRWAGRRDRSVALRAQRKSLSGDGRDHAKPAHDRMPNRPRRRDQPEPRALDIAAKRFNHQHAVAAVHGAVTSRPGELMSGVLVASGARDDFHGTTRSLDVDDDAVGGGGFGQRRSGFTAEEVGQCGRVDQPSNDGIVGIGGRQDICTRSDIREQRPGVVCIAQVALGAQFFEDRLRDVQVPFSGRTRAGLGHEPAEREMTQSGLIPLAEQVEEGRALSEIMVRVGGAARLRMQQAAQPQVLTPGGGRRFRIDLFRGRAKLLLGRTELVRGHQRFGGDQHRLQRVEGRCAGFDNVVGQTCGLVHGAAAQRETRGEHADRPFVPPARLPPVRAVGFAGAFKVLGGGVVSPADQVNLRQRVEDRSGRFVKLNRTADFQRPMQRFFGAREIAEPHANLSHRRQRHRQSVAGAVRFVQGNAAFGERARLLVAMLQEQHVRLVAADSRDDVVGMNGRCQPFGVAQRRHRLVVATLLSERDARQRVHQREVPPIARGKQCRRGLRDVLADNGHIADLAIAVAELVVGETDGARVVSDVGLLQGPAVKRDRAGLIALRRGQTAVEAPERRDPSGRNGFADRVRSTAERGGRLIEIVLQQPCLGEHRPKRELVVARQGRGTQCGGEHLGRICSASAFERRTCACEQCLDRRRWHYASIT